MKWNERKRKGKKGRDGRGRKEKGKGGEGRKERSTEIKRGLDWLVARASENFLFMT